MGPLEIVIILIVGLIAVGPGKLPQLARNRAKGISAFRKATMDLTTGVSKEFESLEKEEIPQPMPLSLQLLKLVLKLEYLFLLTKVTILK